MKKLSTRDIVRISSDIQVRSAYKELQRGSSFPFGIPSCLKPHKNLYTGEITITNPEGKKEVWKEESHLVRTKYKRIR